MGIDSPLETGVLTSKVTIVIFRRGVDARVLCFSGQRALHHTSDRRGAGQEDDLGVGALGHGLHGLEVSDLHGGCAGQNVGRLSHELGGLHLGASGNDLGLSDTLGLRGHGEGVLQLVAEDDVLDEHTLDLYTPS